MAQPDHDVMIWQDMLQGVRELRASIHPNIEAACQFVEIFFFLLQ